MIDRVRGPRVAGLGIALLLYGLLASLYAWAVPPLEGFDSLAHQNYINFLRHTGRLPRLDAETALYSYQLVQQPPFYYLLSALATLPLVYADWHLYIQAAENVYFPSLSARWTVDLPDAVVAAYPGSVAGVWLARGVSMLGGGLAVAGAWDWARTMLIPRQARGQAAVYAQNLLLLVILLFALNPLFLFVAVTVSNDSWAIAGAVWVMALATRLAQTSADSPRLWAMLGIVAGVAALVKYNVLVMTVPVGLLLLVAYRHRPARLVAGSALAFGCALAVAGFWYGRNLVNYGEVIPLQTLAAVIPTLQRETPLTGAESLAGLGWLFRTYWGGFVAVFAPPAFYTFWQIFVGVACAGLLVAQARAPVRDLGRISAVALVWLGTVAVALWYWSRTVAYGEQARLLLIAGPAIALLLGLGWQALLPVRLRGPLLYGMAGLAVLAALWPLPTLRSAHRMPPAVDGESLTAASPTYQPVDSVFGPGMRLVGFDLPTGRAFTPDSSLPLDLYWTADRVIEQDYTLFVHIADNDDRLWYHHDGVPEEGRHPTRQWRPGQVFGMRLELDTRDLEVAEGNASVTFVPHLDNVGVLSLGFYPHDQPENRLVLAELAGETPDVPAPDRLVLADLRRAAEPPDESQTDLAAIPHGAEADSLPLATWEGGIRLLDAAHTLDTHALELTLTWETTDLLSEDWTAFIHVIDAEGGLVAQKDRAPLQGAAPTSTWLPGVPIVDSYVIELPASATEAEAYGLHIGWYNVETGTRLARSAGEASATEDFVHLVLHEYLPK